MLRTLSRRVPLLARRQARAAGALPGAGEAAGGGRAVLPAAPAVELVHSFSLVHDDLPALDDDAERRGRPSVWAAYGEATAILAGDALVAEAFRLACRYAATDVARELVEGDARDDRRPAAGSRGPTRPRRAPPAEDGRALLGVGDVRCGPPACPRPSTRPGARSPPSSGCSSRSSTTSSTATATSPRSGRAHGSSPTRRPGGRAQERLGLDFDADTSVLSRDRRRARRTNGVTPPSGRTGERFKSGRRRRASRGTSSAPCGRRSACG